MLELQGAAQLREWRALQAQDLSRVITAVPQPHDDGFADRLANLRARKAVPPPQGEADEPMEEEAQPQGFKSQPMGEAAHPPPWKKQKSTHELRLCARPCSGVLGRLIRATGGTSYGPCSMKCVLRAGHDARCDCGIGHDFSTS